MCDPSWLDWSIRHRCGCANIPSTSKDHLRLRLGGHSQPVRLLIPADWPRPNCPAFGMNDHLHDLDLSPGFRSLSCFVARAYTDLIWIAGRNIVVYESPSLSSASALSRTHHLHSRQPHKLNGAASSGHTFAFPNPHSLPCVYSIVALLGHQSLKSRILLTLNTRYNQTSNTKESPVFRLSLKSHD